MNTTSKSLLWLSGIAAGVVAGALIYKNRDKMPTDTKKLNQWLNDVKHTLENTSRKLVDNGSKAIQNGTKVLEKELR